MSALAMRLPWTTRIASADAAFGVCTGPRETSNILRRTPAAPRYDDDVLGFDRITQDPELMGGKPCIRGMRVIVGMIVESLAVGRTIEQLLADFPYLEEPDIRQPLHLRHVWPEDTKFDLRVDAGHGSQNL